MDDILTQVEERVTGVAGFQPRRKTREAAPTLHEHGLTVDVVEGVREVQKKGPALIAWQRCHQLGGSMDNGFTTSLDTHS